MSEQRGAGEGGQKPWVRIAGRAAGADRVEHPQLVGYDGRGQGVEVEPAQVGALVRLDDARGAGPGRRGEEVVHPLVDRQAVGAGALHGAPGGQVDVGDPDLLDRLAGGGGEDRLAPLDVAGDGGGPVLVHVAGATPQLEQHLPAAGHRCGAEQEHVGRGHDDERSVMPATLERRSEARMRRVESLRATGSGCTSPTVLSTCGDRGRLVRLVRAPRRRRRGGRPGRRPR